MHPRSIQISEFDYHLPDDRIAVHPLPQRDQSKLLVFREGKIVDAHFYEIPHFLSDQYLLIGNNTRVIPARLFFRKETGAAIEIFCLEPTHKSHQDAMADKRSSTWTCMVGGAKKWKGDEVLMTSFQLGEISIEVFARKSDRNEDKFTIEFSWANDRITFSEILDAAGELPLPPYFNRRAEDEDYERYQTVFAREKGSVAAPTAGLHFTESLITELAQQGIPKLELTLHVGAGTFKPVSSENMAGHSMHSEKFSVSTSLLKALTDAPDKKIITIGTTTTRALESLYWLGLRWMRGEKEVSGIGQWDPYDLQSDTPATEVFQFLLRLATESGWSEIETETTIMIAPGYRFRAAHGLITNFHMPKSTLLLLIAAVTGRNQQTGQYYWHAIYDHALNNQYRFLSYGDSSLLFVQESVQSR